MKKILATSLATSLCFLSLSAFAATEISQKEAESLKHVKSITVTENTVNECVHKISKLADKEGADFFVIKNFSSIGNGSQAVVTSELYRK
ncbi:YdgH/BhsA/McbA-like domain containing protein [Citrobacter arsenatis]|uniref:YdgH/BhsA/McbA-like domain containing protein n=1 Tax=Citrobacter arsenatis TaxID=2546350 RepID=UPI00300DD3CE